MRYIKEGPRGAGAASGAIYEWIGLRGGRPFPTRVQYGITKATEAIFHRYQEDRNVIHAVGPDFREIECDEEGAVLYLAHTYANVFREAVRCYQQFNEVKRLRLLQISSGVFAGGFTKEQMARITARAIVGALKSITKRKLGDLAKFEIKMCIFDPDQVGL